MFLPDMRALFVGQSTREWGCLQGYLLVLLIETERVWVSFRWAQWVHWQIARVRAAMDGIDESSLGEMIGMSSLRFEDWFMHFNGEANLGQVHPYAEDNGQAVKP